MRTTRDLASCFSSIYVERLSFLPSLARAGARFALGECLNVQFYSSARMRDYVQDLSCRTQLAAAVTYSVVMVPYVPAGLPYILEMQDVDSEKWLQYSRARWPGFLYALEARRLRRAEVQYAGRAIRTFFTTEQEEKLFRSFSPEVPTRAMESGVDFDFFDPSRSPEIAELSGRRFAVFVGTMDYYPNVEAVCWFARSVFPELKRREPELEFCIVGRNPSRAVLSLAKLPGIRITGGVADTRPYLKSAAVFVAPFQIARGIQNKVLEALAMGKWVLASTPVCKTFGSSLPAGIIHCPSPSHYYEAFASALNSQETFIRDQARDRFTWQTNLGPFLTEVDSVIARRGDGSHD